MEWVTSNSVVKEAPGSNSMILGVFNMRAEIEKAKLAGLTIDGALTHETQLLIYSKFLVGKADLEKDNCPIKFCCFSNQEP